MIREPWLGYHKDKKITVYTVEDKKLRGRYETKPRKRFWRNKGSRVSARINPHDNTLHGYTASHQIVPNVTVELIHTVRKKERAHEPADNQALL